MPDLHTYASDQIEKLRGPNREDAICRLSNADPSIIPILIEAFRTENDPDVREALVGIVWRYRSPGVLEFLSEAMQDSDPRVWKQALDGFVAIGGTAAISPLKSAKNRAESVQDRLEWIDEAIEQIASAMGG